MKYFSMYSAHLMRIIAKYLKFLVDIIKIQEMYKSGMILFYRYPDSTVACIRSQLRDDESFSLVSNFILIYHYFRLTRLLKLKAACSLNYTVHAWFQYPVYVVHRFNLLTNQRELTTFGGYIDWLWISANINWQIFGLFLQCCRCHLLLAVACEAKPGAQGKNCALVQLEITFQSI